MPTFKYKALNSSHETVGGLVEAENENAAADILKENGLSIISLGEESSGGALLLGKISNKDIVIFTRQFAVMVSANVALVHALKIMVDQTENPRLKMVISELSDEVNGGMRLSDALEKRKKIFSQFYVSVVRSGETSGKLDEVLNYLADEMERDYDMTGKIKGAMIYPAFVLTGLTAVGVLMMVFVVPKLTGIMTETNAELPFATKILIGASHFMSKFWYILVAAIIGSIAGVKLSLRTPVGRKIFDQFKLKIPIFGKLLGRIYLVRFTRSMETLIKGGVTINQSLVIAADVVGNEVYREIIQETIKKVEDGNSISSVFMTRKEIPSMVSQMLNIGEKTGKIDMVLEKITDFYSREINNIVANLMTLMEPIIMVIMGVAVGVMVAAIIMPMYSLANQA